MVKRCFNCEDYLPYTAGICGADGGPANENFSETCESWIPKHGEWIPMSVAWPDEDEVVSVLLVVFTDENYTEAKNAIVTPARFGHFGFSFDALYHVPEHSRALFWMRPPKLPELSDIMQEMRKHAR